MYNPQLNHLLIFSQSLQSALAGGEEEVKKRMSEMSRRVTVLQIKEQVTGRKALILQEREESLRKVGSG